MRLDYPISAEKNKNTYKKIQIMNIMQGSVYVIIMCHFILTVAVTNHFCISLSMYGIYRTSVY